MPVPNEPQTYRRGNGGAIYQWGAGGTPLVRYENGVPVFKTAPTPELLRYAGIGEGGKYRVGTQNYVNQGGAGQTVNAGWQNP